MEQGRNPDKGEENDIKIERISTAVRHNTLETWRMSQRGDGHVKGNCERKRKKKEGGSW